MEGDAALRVFSYAVAEKADVYVAIVDTLMEAKERFQLQVRPTELIRHLADRMTFDAEPTIEEVADALDSLFGWGNVSRFYDPAAPETLHQFYAKRFLYQLAEAGVAAHDGIRAVRRVGLDTGRLSGVLLPAIVEGLRAIQAEAARPAPDPARLYGSFIGLFNSFKELADNAARDMDALSVEMAGIATDDESFLAYKRAVFTYLTEFVARLTQTVPEVASLITALDPSIVELIEAAAAADEAPTLDKEDDGVRRSFTERWSGVRACFVTTRPEASIADSLRMAMLDAINRILAALDRLHERHLRRVSREADFTQLARWFATMDDGDAARLWDHAFGLWRPSRRRRDRRDSRLRGGPAFRGRQPSAVVPGRRRSETALPRGFRCRRTRSSGTGAPAVARRRARCGLGRFSRRIGAGLGRRGGGGVRHRRAPVGSGVRLTPG
jgi:uncharacterized protein (TIGR02677 family)